MKIGVYFDIKDGFTDEQIMERNSIKRDALWRAKKKYEAYLAGKA